MKMNIVSLILVSFVLVACESASVLPSNSAEVTETINVKERKIFDNNHQVWLKEGIQNYSFIWQQSCFCPVEFNEAMEVTVKNGKIIDVRSLATGQPVSPSVFKSIQTVEQIFAMLDKVIDTAHKVDIGYHSSFGFPQKIYVDRDFRMADEEIQLSIDSFTIN